MHTTLIVARHVPGSEKEIARLFTESDGTGLPEEIGVHTRKLFTFHDIYIHLVESQAPVGRAIDAAHANPLFQQISTALDAYIRPFEERWGDAERASAKQFYEWRRGEGVVRSGYGG
ncbi:TcmI family type II polyketide cyclase [Streptomyces niveiscabiei]|uniref:TcmI family type II polyketide cyclase n=1 Tax=Streptomyces niveiscabiei TaxID=164115 RepID=A0ABW9HGZ2_9ACTN